MLAAQPPVGMGSEVLKAVIDPKDVVGAFISAINRRDLDGLVPFDV